MDLKPKSAAVEKCPLCQGTGKREIPSFVDPSKKITKTCSACRGKGKIKMSKSSVITYKGALYRKAAGSSKCKVVFQDTDRGIDAILLSSDGRSLNMVHTGKKTLSDSEKSKLTTKLMAGCSELSKDYKKSPK